MDIRALSFPEKTGLAIEFHLGGNYRLAVASAKSLLKAAGIPVLESRYVEYEQDTQKHHCLLAEFGRG